MEISKELYFRESPRKQQSEQWFPKCGLHTCSTSITWEPARNADSCTHSRLTESRPLEWGPEIYFKKQHPPHQVFVKVKNCCSGNTLSLPYEYEQTIKDE